MALLPLTVALLWIAACGSDASAPVVSDCREPADCVGGTCVQGRCVPAGLDGGLDAVVDTDAAVEVDLPDVPDVPDQPDAPDTDDAGDALDTGVDTDATDATDADAAEIPEGEAGAACTSDADCLFGPCINSSLGRVCTTRCSDACPFDWECRVLSGSGSDVLQICVPPTRVLCRACESDPDCGVGDNLCLPQLDGTFCGTRCSVPSDCPTGYACDSFFNDLDEQVGQCVPELGICGNCLDGDRDGFGVGAGCMGLDCDDLNRQTYEGAPELCDGEDNDCDGTIDEGFDFAADVNHCGGCGLVCRAPRVRTSTCSADGCRVATCEDGFYDRNGLFADGCEYACTPVVGEGGVAVETCNGADDDCDGTIDEGFDLQTDSANCGVCGTTCDLEGAEAVCLGGRCRIGSCAAPLADCNGLTEDGCETNTLSSAAHCGGCDQTCAPRNAGGACVGGLCEISACADGYTDCNDSADDGCEVQTSRDLGNCGACGAVCSFPGATASCEAGVCQFVACRDGFADCNDDPTDGCEVDLRSDDGNCGSCGRTCDLANADGTCAARECTVTSCADGYADCNRLAPDGCEVNIDQDVRNCGTCGATCALPNATAVCTDGGCAIAACADGFADCNGNPSDGCEVDLRSNLSNCGTCGNACTAANGTATCDAGVCEVASCNFDYADCNGVYADGCEIFTRFNDANCGACGNSCAVTNAASACTGTSCTFFSCTAGYGNCNGSLADGCETDLSDDANNCGRCGNVCSFPNSEGICVAELCQPSGCAVGFANCDGFLGNGCETVTTNNNLNCGGCGIDCASAIPNAGAVCAGSSCTFTSCSGTFRDCNANLIDGCETDTSTSNSNCGGCGIECAIANASTSCVASSCRLDACTAPFENCDANPLNGCESNTNTSLAHCGGCNRPCSFPNALATCTLGGCSMGDCVPGFVNLDGDTTNGCEYACTVTSGTDLPDTSFVDANCDGVDGDKNGGVFVSLAGRALGAGTMNDPVNSLGAGIAIAQASPGRRWVYVAEGVYTGNFELPAGVHLAGGYRPVSNTQWRRFANGTAASVISSTTTTGLLIQNATADTIVQNMVIQSQNANTAGQSSYGVRVLNAPGVRLQNNAITAGDGAPGVAGTAGIAGAGGNKGGDGEQGCDGCSSQGNGGAGGTQFCGDRSAPSGGAGGRGGHDGDAGSGGAAGDGSVDGVSGGTAGGGGRGYDNTCVLGCDVGGTGGGGNGGNTGVGRGNAPGGSGGNVVGGLWSGNAGGVSSRAGHGSGGGGGGGGGSDACCRADRGGGGGGGGSGGCGGYPGTAGTAGGGSFGVFAVNSTGMQLTGNSVTSRAGAAGGAGANGGAGGAGGLGSAGGARADDGGPGGGGAAGGPGGRAGCSGGGAGGPSYAIFRSNTTVGTGGNQLFFGSGGSGGGGCSLGGNFGFNGASGTVN